MVVPAMTPSILEGVTRRVEYLRALTDPSRSQPTSASFLLDVMDGLRSGVLLRDYLHETCKLLWKNVIENELEEIDFAGRMYLICLSIARTTLTAVRSRAYELKTAALQDASPDFDKALADFDQATNDVAALEQDFTNRWPWLDQEKLQKSVAAERQGVRRRSLQEIHDDIRRRVR
jgi:hypothetical protein